LVLALAWRDGVRIPVWAARMLVAAGAAVFAWSWSQGHFFGPDSVLRVFAWGLPAFAIVGAFALCEKPVTANLFWRVCGFLGDASYSLYLVLAGLRLPRRCPIGEGAGRGRGWSAALAQSDSGSGVSSADLGHRELVLARLRLPRRCLLLALSCSGASAASSAMPDRRRGGQGKRVERRARSV